MTWLVLAAIAAVIAWFGIGASIGDNWVEVTQRKNAANDKYLSDEERAAHRLWLERNSANNASLSKQRFMIVLGILAVGIAGWFWAGHTDSKTVDAYKAGWHDGWVQGCDSVFLRLSTSGELYYNNNKVSERVCLGAEAPPDTTGFDASQYNDVSGERRGGDRGYTQAIIEVFRQYPELCYGPDCISIDTFTNQ